MCIAINLIFFYFDRAYHLLGKRIVAVKVRTIHMSLFALKSLKLCNWKRPLKRYVNLQEFTGFP